MNLSNSFKIIFAIESLRIPFYSFTSGVGEAPSSEFSSDFVNFIGVLSHDSEFSFSLIIYGFVLW